MGGLRGPWGPGKPGAGRWPRRASQPSAKHTGHVLCTRKPEVPRVANATRGWPKARREGRPVSHAAGVGCGQRRRGPLLWTGDGQPGPPLRVALGSASVLERASFRKRPEVIRDECWSMAPTRPGAATEDEAGDTQTAVQDCLTGLPRRRPALMPPRQRPCTPSMPASHGGAQGPFEKATLKQGMCSGLR